jgi:hypothetical protein
MSITPHAFGVDDIAGLPLLAQTGHSFLPSAEGCAADLETALLLFKPSSAVLAPPRSTSHGPPESPTALPENQEAGLRKRLPRRAARMRSWPGELPQSFPKFLPNTGFCCFAAPIPDGRVQGYCFTVERQLPIRRAQRRDDLVPAPATAFVNDRRQAHAHIKRSLLKIVRNELDEFV